MADPSVESVVSMPILNPETGGMSRTFRFMGVVDRLDDDKIIDWKGVADTARFISMSRIGFQGELYALAKKHEGVEIREIEYRLITRPTIRFSPGVTSYAVVREGRKTAVKLFNDKKEAETFAGALRQTCTVEERIKGDRDRDAYEERCLDWLANEPMKVLTFVYHISKAKLKQAQWALWDASKRILEARQHDRWLTNTQACFAYNRECPFIDLCDAVQNGADYVWIADEQFIVANSSHPELQGADRNVQVLTHSSISDLTRCEQYYYWKHERRFRKQVVDESEALWTGSAIHRGLEAYALNGVDAAFAAIDGWANENPIIGEDVAIKQDQQIARARAMVRAAKLKWPDVDQPPAGGASRGILQVPGQNGWSEWAKREAPPAGGQTSGPSGGDAKRQAVAAETTAAPSGDPATATTCGPLRTKVFQLHVSISDQGLADIELGKCGLVDIAEVRSCNNEAALKEAIEALQRLKLVTVPAKGKGAGGKQGKLV